MNNIHLIYFNKKLLTTTFLGAIHTARQTRAVCIGHYWTDLIFEYAFYRFWLRVDERGRKCGPLLHMSDVAWFVSWVGL